MVRVLTRGLIRVKVRVLHRVIDEDAADRGALRSTSLTRLRGVDVDVLAPLTGCVTAYPAHLAHVLWGAGGV